jgi:UPF0755 protein
MRRVLVPLVLLVATCAALVGVAQRWYRSPLPGLAEAVTVEVPSGARVGVVADRLAVAGVLDQPQLWSLLTRLSGRSRRLRAGEYLIRPGSTPESIAEQLVEGRIVLHPVTLVEGWTVAEALASVAASDVLRHDLVAGAAAPAALMTALGLGGQPAEGRFFPDTYLVARHSSDVELFRQAHARLAAILAEAWAGRAPDLPLKDEAEALTLASIIEKETAAPEERALISAVFVNRLRHGMRLQTDPTVIYGLGASYGGALHHADLTSDTPYNTYTREGLPPTPIALAGRESIVAAVHPADSGALYFVALGDGSGHHAFSATLADHNAAVGRYVAALRGRRSADGGMR